MPITTALRLNAVLSLSSGALLTAAAATVGDWLGVSVDGWLRLLGLALLGHGVLLVWITTRDDLVGWTKVNLAIIAPYPALMVALVLSGVIDRGLGQGLAIADGALVGLCALAQWSGLRTTATAPHPLPV